MQSPFHSQLLSLWWIWIWGIGFWVVYRTCSRTRSSTKFRFLANFKFPIFVLLLVHRKSRIIQVGAWLVIGDWLLAHKGHGHGVMVGDFVMTWCTWRKCRYLYHVPGTQRSRDLFNIFQFSAVALQFTTDRRVLVLSQPQSTHAGAASCSRRWLPVDLLCTYTELPTVADAGSHLFPTLNLPVRVVWRFSELEQLLEHWFMKIEDIQLSHKERCSFHTTSNKRQRQGWQQREESRYHLVLWLPGRVLYWWEGNKLGLDVTFTLTVRMTILFVYRLTVTHDLLQWSPLATCHLPIVIWIWITDGRWRDGWLLQLITNGCSPSACQFPIATSNDLSAIVIASTLCHCEYSLQITYGHFDHLLRVSASYWLPLRMNDLPIVRWPIVIYWLQTTGTDCHFRLPWRRTICHFTSLRISDCRLLITWYQIITTSQGRLPIAVCRLPIADYKVSE